LVSSSTVCAFLFGCPGVGTDGDVGTPLDGNRDENVTSAAGKTSGEPNDTFDTFVAAVFDEQGVARLHGTVTGRGDLDVYFLGALSPGDRVTAEITTPGSPLDVSVALFDASRRLVFAIDDNSDSLDASIDWIARHAGEDYYLVITHSAFAESGRFSGGYLADVQVRPGFVVPSPVPQTFVLDFDGGMVDSPALGRLNLDPFDAADISQFYDGQTDVLKNQIAAVFQQNYERFAIIVLTTDDPVPSGPVSRVFFGGFNRAAFGIAETVDLYNVEFCDDAIIYTESFSLGVFSTPPTVEEMGVAIGNVAAHEAGHLLGLNHVDDDLDLMDDRSAADAFLVDQEFKESPLSSDIMPIGSQDGVLLLNATVGSP